MKLSIVILNYKVPYFLEQCLASVYRSVTNFEYEVLVVDNNSQDHSLDMVADKFPQAICIANQENVGFSAGNNVAIKQAKGDFILLLNPDTVIDENCLQASLDFMLGKKDAGALGIKMLDGSGEFLPESKRGLPSPWVAFYKIFGLSKIFKGSEKFGKYHLSYLDKDENHEVDVLAGAFMLLRKEALDKSGLLDEQFFMYGEDIDLSYRVQQAGYKNYYFAKSPIIHYKGESTKTGSLNYVKVFYQAMILFAKKHFSGSKAFWFIAAIKLAIYLRASMALASRLATRIAIPIADAGILYAGMYYLKNYWESNHRYIEGGSYPTEFMSITVPAYIVVWLASAFFSGGYDKPVSLFRFIRGLAVGTLILFAAYGLLPEAWRFSRALIMLGAAWAAMSLPLLRIIVNKIKLFNFKLAGSEKRRMLLICEPSELESSKSLLMKLRYPAQFAAWVSKSKPESLKDNWLGSSEQLEDIANAFNINEFVFNANSISYADIIRDIEKLNYLDAKIRIIPPKAAFIIGSDSAKHAGDALKLVDNRLLNKSVQRAKRISDLILCLLSFLLIPIQKRPFTSIKNLFQVLIAKSTWVGTKHLDHQLNKEAVLPIRYNLKSEISTNSEQILERDYLENYEVFMDWQIWWKHRRNL